MHPAEAAGCVDLEPGLGTPSAFEFARFYFFKLYRRVCSASKRVGQFLEVRRMLPHRLCHRRLGRLLSPRSLRTSGRRQRLCSAPRASRISSTGTRDASETFRFQCPVSRFQRITRSCFLGTGLPNSLSRMCFRPSSILLTRNRMEPRVRAMITSPSDRPRAVHSCPPHVFKHAGGHSVSPCSPTVLLGFVRFVTWLP